MTDLYPMFDRIAGASAAPDADALTADLSRGRRALARRRGIVLGGGMCLLVLAAGVATVGTQGSTADDPGAAPSAAVAPEVASPGIEFVAYAGEQPAGFRVATVPDGWQLQVVDEYSLVIAPPELMDTHPDSFEGKLVVSLRSPDFVGEPAGTAISVGERTGFVTRPGVSDAMLYWTDAAGNDLVAQWPDTKEWTDQGVADFAAGVEVLAGVKAARG